MRGRWADNAYHFPTVNEPTGPAPVNQYELQASTNANTRYIELCNELADIINDRRATWRQHAACKGIGPDLFFAEKGDNYLAGDAKQVCDTCPVADECDDYATSRHLRFGVWGGKAGRNRNRGQWDKGSA